MSRSLALLGATAAVIALAAPAASAAPSCTFDPGNGLVTVDLAAAGDAAILSADGGAIQVADATCAGGPTVNNTTNILVNDNSAGTTSVTIIRPTEFAPGAPQADEDVIPEIELVMNLGAGTDLVELTDGTNASRWRVGTGGLNFNAGAGGFDADADISFISGTSRRIELNGGPSADLLSAQGGEGTGGPFTAGTVLLTGQGGNDTLEGGNGGLGSSGDELVGGLGDDTVRGFGARDILYPDPGDDLLDCGAGTEDLLDFTGVQIGITLDLASTAPQPNGLLGSDTIGGGCEFVRGTGQADRLSGTDAAEVLAGRGGSDALNGRGGADVLAGEDGADTATYADAPAAVSASLTTGTASGGGGADAFVAIENLTGSAFDDALTGDGAANTITGLGGADTISALDGPDLVEARDGGPDSASCGAGLDGTVADRRSVDAIDADCEVVDALPEADAPDPDPPPAEDRELEFALSGKAKQRVLRRDGVAVRASCPHEDCTVSFGGKVKERVEALAAGRAEKVELALSRKRERKLKAALERGRKPKLAVTARATDAAGNSATGRLEVRARR